MLSGTEKTDQPRAEIIAEWLASDSAARADGFDDYAQAFIKKDGGIFATLATRSVLKESPEIGDDLAGEAQRIQAVQNCAAPW